MTDRELSADRSAGVADDVADEIEAMSKIQKALQPLNDAQRARVIRWAAERYSNAQRIRT